MSPADHPGTGNTPLCVDMDGTLVRTDTLIELWLRAFFQDFARALATLLELRNGKAAFKRRLSELVRLDAALLPYNEELVAYLRSQKEDGRVLVLATGSHMTLAKRVANHLGIFDDVIATEGTRNLRGTVKADALQERFNHKGFSYAGNDAKDLPVWKVAVSAVIVSAPKRVLRRVSVPVEAVFAGQARGKQLLKALRVYQWAKNLLVFLPVITANALNESMALLNAVGAFFCISIVASGVYIVNDLIDLDADRAHPSKQDRPFASGHLPLGLGALGPALMAAGIVAGFALNAWLGVVLVAYVGLTTAYSFALKTMPLVDVFTLAGLFTLRIVAGGVSTGYFPSIWLLSFSGFLFLSLAMLKRYVELASLAEAEIASSRRDYLPDENLLLLVFGICSSFSAAIVLALYVELSIGKTAYDRPEFIWGLVPLVLFWSCRLWLAAYRGYVDADPIVFAFKDWVSRFVAVIGAVLYALAALAGS